MLQGTFITCPRQLRERDTDPAQWVIKDNMRPPPGYKLPNLDEGEDMSDMFEPPEVTGDKECPERAARRKTGVGEGQWDGDFGYLEPASASLEDGAGKDAGHIVFTAGWVLYEEEEETESVLYRVTARVPLSLAQSVSASGGRMRGGVERLVCERLILQPVDPDEPHE